MKSRVMETIKSMDDYSIQVKLDCFPGKHSDRDGRINLSTNVQVVFQSSSSQLTSTSTQRRIIFYVTTEDSSLRFDDHDMFSEESGNEMMELIEGMNIPFSLKNLHWKSSFLNLVKENKSLGNDKGGLITELEKYFKKIRNYCESINNLYFVLDITKTVILREDKFRTFKSWAEKNLSDYYKLKETEPEFQLRFRKLALAMLEKVIVDGNTLMTLPENTCPICWELLMDRGMDSKIRRMPTCHHLYHEGCIVAWLSTNESCPNCRRETPRIIRD